MPLRLRQEVQALPRPPHRLKVIPPLLLGAAACAAAAPAAADNARESVARRACAALQARVDAVPGPAPLFLRSYDGGAGSGPPPEPALQGAFTYDNALAAIALVACGKPVQAQRIGEALRLAATGDRSGIAGRMRNAYRPGPLKSTAVPPMGWWSESEQRWDEDPYQVSIATGNAAWAGLALLTLHQVGHDRRDLAAAAALGRWIVQSTADAQPPAGFTGGLYGYDDAPQRLGWKSTEHNTDAAALFDWLARLQPQAGWRAPAATARSFVAQAFDAGALRFGVGTLPDGRTPNTSNTGLDAQLWPLLLANAPPSWRGSLDSARHDYGTGAGFDFNADRDGVWWEGTAQAALVYRLAGRESDADRIFAALDGAFSDGGYLWATDRPRITTGLALSPQSTTDDFYYYRLPHLAPTAWAALAAIGWNPFTGKPVSLP
jgi:hypothetical protein